MRLNNELIRKKRRTFKINNKCPIPERTRIASFQTNDIKKNINTKYTYQRCKGIRQWPNNLCTSPKLPLLLITTSG